jgi:Bardet-Biedl syndrome 2 protein
MLSPSFTIQLGHPIVSGHVTIGSFDGVSPSLVCATTGGKVLLHSPHNLTLKGPGLNPHVSFLNINREISGLCCANIDASLGRDVLLVGSPTSLLAYDVHENSDCFFVEIPDGVTKVAVGVVKSIADPSATAGAFSDSASITSREVSAVVGGHCSIQGFNKMGIEEFWTVTGGSVTALGFCDVNGDGVEELLVGSDDYEIRCFQQEETIFEVTETDAVTHLSPIVNKRFVYALANGTVGVYDGSTRLWRVKAKDTVTSVVAFDLDDDGVPEVIIGTSFPLAFECV